MTREEYEEAVGKIAAKMQAEKETWRRKQFMQEFAALKPPPDKREARTQAEFDALDSLVRDIVLLDLEIRHHQGFSFITDIFREKRAELVKKYEAIAGPSSWLNDAPDW